MYKKTMNIVEFSPVLAYNVKSYLKGFYFYVLQRSEVPGTISGMPLFLGE